MKIELTNGNRARIAEMFESAAEVIKQQASHHTSTAIIFLDYGVVVEVHGTMEGSLPPGVPAPDIRLARYGLLIRDGKLIAGDV